MEEEAGTPRAQVTIYGPLVIVVLSLWPAPSEKWRLPVTESPEGCPWEPCRLGQVAQWGELKTGCSHHLLVLALPLCGCPAGLRGRLPSYA